MARYSKRSFVAVLTFLGCGMITASIVSPKTPWAITTAWFRATDGTRTSPTSNVLGSTLVAVSVFLALIRHMNDKDTTSIEDVKLHQRKSISSAVAGSMAAIGLAVSGMIKTSKVLGFLDVGEFFRSDHQNYDPTLMTVLGSALIPAWIAYQLIGYNNTNKQQCLIEKPICCKNWCLPTNTTIDTELVASATLFGIGWGIAGLCPGPAIFQAARGVIPVVVAWMPSYFAGSYVGFLWKEYKVVCPCDTKKSI